VAIVVYHLTDMNDLPRRAAPPPLATLDKGGPAALFLDFDGTLVELAPTPNSIAPRHDLAQRLAALSQRLGGRLALVSGRSIDDLRAWLGPISVVMAGSHGGAIECSEGKPMAEQARGIGDQAMDQLRQFSAKAGLDLEEKTHGAALHFRAAPELDPDAQAFADDLAEKGVSKGRAVDQIMAASPFRGAVPWFVGDDVTDEDGFAACIKLGGEAVLVGERESSCARRALPSVAAVHHWLEFE
jgi:trehalose 6-phosphate phosphatase